MGDEYVNFLSSAAKMIAPSGNEKDVLDLWISQISKYVSKVHFSTLGNAVALKHGNGVNKKRIMLAAHADEIGLIITYIDNNGFLFFNEIGGVDLNLLAGRRVLINGVNEIVYGVIGAKPIHLQEINDNKQNLSADSLWIDIGAKDKNEALVNVQIGCVATLDAEFSARDGKYIGKALDNRSSMAVLISLAKALSVIEVEHDIYYVATTQEEIRARGAQTAAFSINPDVCIVLDVTHATDYPFTSPLKDGDIQVGKGVVIALGPNMDNYISKKLLSTAIENNINYQLEAIARPSGTDANTIQTSCEGIPTGLVSLPCRYMHTPVETVEEEDMNMMTNLLIKFISNFK